MSGKVVAGYRVKVSEKTCFIILEVSDGRRCSV